MAVDDNIKKMEEEAKKLEDQRQALFKKIQEQKKSQEQGQNKDEPKKKESDGTEKKREFKVAADSDIFRLIVKTLSLMDKKILVHSCKVAYIYFRMLQYTKRYSKQELAQYAVIGLLHDLGEFKVQNNTRKNVRVQYMNNAWVHSIYGYLYIRQFSPLGEKGNVVLYHHSPFEKLDDITTDDKLEAAMLALSDHIERLLAEYDTEDSMKNMFAALVKMSENSDIMTEVTKISLNAMREFNIATKISSGEYEEELYDFLENLKLSESEKRKYLELLMYAADFQTDESFLDNLRTNCISEQLGKVMLVSEHERKVLAYGTLLYDIGKFALPLDILRKPGKLTDAERDIINSHASYTEYLLKDIFDQEIIDVAARHHERLDGTGYPRGLQGEELKLCERILAVADVVSALSADRSYRKALPKAKILEIMLKNVEENKMCPHVVNALVKRYDIIMNNARIDVQKASKEFVVETAIAFNQLYARLLS